MNGRHELPVPAGLGMIIAAALVFSPIDANAKPHRSRAEVSAFKREHPCPSTGKGSGRCPGYIVDHVKPLCAGGPDRPSKAMANSGGCQGQGLAGEAGVQAPVNDQRGNQGR